MNIKKLNEELQKLTEKALTESLDDIIFDTLVEYADNEGLNVADLIDYDLQDIAEYVSDVLGRSVSVKKIEKLIQEEVEASEEIEMQYDEE